MRRRRRPWQAGVLAGLVGLALVYLLGPPAWLVRSSVSPDRIVYSAGRAAGADGGRSAVAPLAAGTRIVVPACIRRGSRPGFAARSACTDRPYLRAMPSSVSPRWTAWVPAAGGVATRSSSAVAAVTGVSARAGRAPFVSTAASASPVPVVARVNDASRAPIASSTRFARHVDGTLLLMMLKASCSPLPART